MERAVEIRTASRSADAARRRPAVFPLGAGLAAVALASTFLAAWALGTPPATEWAALRMKTNSAVCLLLAGLALAASSLRRRWAGVLGGFLAAASGLLGAATLVEYAGGLDLGIDQFLATDVLQGESARFPNRMAPSAALGYFWTGLSLSLIGRRRAWVAAIAQALSLATLALGFIALIGYLYDVPALYRPVPYFPLPPYTAIGLVVVSLGVLGLRQDVGIPRLLTSAGTGGYLVRRLLTVAILAPVGLEWLKLEGTRRGWYPTAVGTSLLVIVTIVGLVVALVFLGRSLDAADAHRRGTEEDLRRTLELTAALAHAATVGEVADAVLRLALPALGASAGAVLLVPEDGDVLNLAGATGYEEFGLRQFRRVAQGSVVPVADASRTGAAVFVRSRHEFIRRYPSVHPDVLTPHRAWAALPLQGRGRTLGVIALSFSDRRAFGDAEQERLTTVASHCGQALDRAFLFESEKAARRRAATAGSAGSVGTWELNVGEDRLFADEALASMLGLDPQAASRGLPLDSYLRAVHEADREKVASSIRQALRDGTRYEAEYRVVGADGSVRWVSARGLIERDESGKPQRFPGALMDVTERKTVEDQLDRTEREKDEARAVLDTIFATAPVGLAFIDRELRYVRMNPTLAALDGLRPEDAPGKRVADVLPPDVASWAIPRLQRVLEGGAPVIDEEFPRPLAGAPGSARYWRVRYYPVPGPDGRPLGVGVVLTDLTAPRQAQDRAQRLQRFAAALTGVRDVSGAATAIAAQAGHAFDADAAAVLLGSDDQATLTVAATHGKLSLDEAACAELRAAPRESSSGAAELPRTAESLLRQGYASFVGAPIGHERAGAVLIAWTRRREGDPEDLAVVQAFAQESAQALERARLHASEETARSELKAASARLHAALEAAAIGTYSRDFSTGRVEHDLGIKHIFGFGTQEGEDANAYAARLHPDDRAAWVAALERCSREGSDFEMRYRICLPGGAVRWVLDKGTTTRDASGLPSYLTGAVVDLTAEEIAREAAEAASRAKDEFLAMLGHELRNPLSPIVTALELMKLRGERAFEKERSMIERQVRHMVRLVDDLLDVSRITRGMVELKRTEVELSEVVQRAVEVTSPLFEQRGHELSVSVPGHGLAVLVDEQRFTQVVANLLSNAAKYTEPGGKVTVEAERAGDRVVLRVADTGIGIAPHLIPRVFDLFVQGGRTLERSEGGLGLGLAIVRTLVIMHGGTVRAESAGPGKGSVFTVALPARAAEIDARQAAGGPKGQVRDGAAASPRRVLVVDDNRDAAESLADAIRGGGHEVRIAYDGPSALALGAEFQPQVAFLDIGLPVMDGYEVGRRLRGMDFGRELKLVAVTGYGLENDRVRSEDAGFDQHLVKPIELESVLAIVAGAIPDGPRRDGATGPLS